VGRVRRVGQVGRIVLAAALAAALGGCGGGSPSSPSTGPVGYEGRWTGSVLLAGAMTFTVSRDQKVTAIEFDYRLNGCSGRISVTNQNLPIFDYPPLGPSFEYRSTDFTQPNYVTVFGSFRADGTASGYIGFGQYAGCGDGGGSWAARR
jgi:hypothetical protein